MTEPQHVTIDLTVARDFLDRGRPRHALAEQLFERAEQGEIELAVAPQGHRLDADGDLAEQLAATVAEEDVHVQPQLAYPSSVTFPAKDLYPGAYVKGFTDAWTAIVDDWRSHEGKPPGDADRLHVETHLYHRGDVFLTDDRALLVMCRRLSDERGLDVTAMGLTEYIEAHGQQAGGEGDDGRAT